MKIEITFKNNINEDITIECKEYKITGSFINIINENNDGGFLIPCSEILMIKWY